METDTGQGSVWGADNMEQLVTGLVKQNWDEDHKNMVQVEYYLGEAGLTETVWMPVMAPYAGPGYGMYLFPEVGAEVVVGFRFGDSGKPFVMGSLLNEVNSVPGDNATENNAVRMLKTKAGYTVSVDEDKKEARFTDPSGKNAFIWSVEEDHGCLVLDIQEKMVIRLGGEDFLTMEKEKATFKGRITVHGEEIAVESEKNLSVECARTMTLKPEENLELKGRNVEVSPDQGFQVKGMKAEITPSQQLGLKAQQTKIEGAAVALSAQASMKIEASGITEVKGAMVKLN